MRARTRRTRWRAILLRGRRGESATRRYQPQAMQGVGAAVARAPATKNISRAGELGNSPTRILMCTCVGSSARLFWRPCKRGERREGRRRCAVAAPRTAQPVATLGRPKIFMRPSPAVPTLARPPPAPVVSAHKVTKPPVHAQHHKRGLPLPALARLRQAKTGSRSTRLGLSLPPPGRTGGQGWKID